MRDKYLRVLKVSLLTIKESVLKNIRPFLIKVIGSLPGLPLSIRKILRRIINRVLVTNVSLIALFTNTLTARFQV